MQVAQEEPKRATYEDPMKAARGRLESMQQVADLLTRQAEEMARELAEKPAEVGAPPSPSNILEDAPLKAELAAPVEASVEEPEEKPAEKPVEKPKAQPNMKAFLATQPQAGATSSLNAVA